jgi:hypothetical protein
MQAEISSFLTNLRAPISANSSKKEALLCEAPLFCFALRLRENLPGRLSGGRGQS